MKYYFASLACSVFAIFGLVQCTSHSSSPKSSADAKVLSSTELQQKIAEKVSNPNLQKAFLQDAIGLQLIAQGNTEYDKIARQSDLTDSCMYSLGVKFDGVEMTHYLEDLIFNSHEKRLLYIKYNSYFSGKVIRGIKNSIENCNFKVE